MNKKNKEQQLNELYSKKKEILAEIERLEALTEEDVEEVFKERQAKYEGKYFVYKDANACFKILKLHEDNYNSADIIMVTREGIKIKKATILFWNMISERDANIRFDAHYKEISKEEFIAKFKAAMQKLEARV